MVVGLQSQFSAVGLMLGCPGLSFRLAFCLFFLPCILGFPLICIPETGNSGPCCRLLSTKILGVSARPVKEPLAASWFPCKRTNGFMGFCFLSLGSCSRGVDIKDAVSCQKYRNKSRTRPSSHVPRQDSAILPGLCRRIGECGQGRVGPYP